MSLKHIREWGYNSDPRCRYVVSCTTPGNSQRHTLYIWGWSRPGRYEEEKNLLPHARNGTLIPRSSSLQPSRYIPVKALSLLVQIFMAINTLKPKTNLNNFQKFLSYCTNKPKRLAWRYRTTLVFGECPVRFSAGTPAVLTEAYRSLPQSLHANAGIVLQSGKAASFQILSNSSSSNILSSNVTYSR
jgi:hypothetical protein